MKEFLVFNDKMLIDMKKVLTSGAEIEKFKKNLTALLKYVDGDFKTQIDLYKGVIDVDSIVLENQIPAKYRFLVRNIDLKATYDFMREFCSRLGDFKANPNACEVCIGFYTLYYATVVKLVDIYLGACSAYNVSTTGAAIPDMNDIGIDNSILRYYSLMEDLRQKTVDEWIALNIPDDEARYISSAIKRIMLIFGY
jgi:hypothetical protein